MYILIEEAKTIMLREGKKTLSTEARHRVTIQVSTNTRNTEGGDVETWADSATVWASVSPITAMQQMKFKSVNVDATHLIKFRGYVSVVETNRIVFGARIFEVLTVEDLQERGI
jgi:SPP1 family predicted phage head-tail adaptor